MEIVDVISGADSLGVCAVLVGVSVAACTWMAHQWVKERDRSAQLTKSLLQVSANAVNVVERVSQRG